ncbi:MAG: sugar-binding domain-containing protein [Limisphaerales bacterium]
MHPNKRGNHIRVHALLLFLTLCVWAKASDTVSLAGNWRFSRDREDRGIKERWFETKPAGKIHLPGTLPANGIGDDVSTNTPWMATLSVDRWFDLPQYRKYAQPGNFKFPFWLQPEKYYAGVAWYQREVTIPRDWSTQRIALSLERPHWETRVWLDGKLIGCNDGLATPHDYDFGQVTPGKHTLTIRVDNGRVVDIGPNSHSVTDHTQGNWNGIVGKMELRAVPLVSVEHLEVYPNVAKKTARVVVVSTNTTGKLFWGKLSLFVEFHGKTICVPVSQNFKTDARDLTTDDEIELGANAPLWDEFSPNVLSLRAELRGDLDGKHVEHSQTVTFGLREVSTRGTQLTINGHNMFVRGTLDCCIYPLTGHPPTDVKSWERTIRICKEHGLNLIRFHSWCPPEAAFIAADEIGFYFHVEASSWANQGTTIGDNKALDGWIYAETDRILKSYGNHPSLLLMAYGNEPAGTNVTKFLGHWVEHYKARDPRRLWTSGAGWPQLSQNQFHITPDPRIQRWGAALKSRINAKAPETTTDYADYIGKRDVPVISHEIGQWCVYPNFEEIPKYKGYLKPKNFEIFQDRLKEHHMLQQAHDFLLASGKLQTLCYKEEIEAALRTHGMGGFELLDLHDFPGQGTALVGVLDPFWDEKPYVTAKEYNRFCNATVPLVRMPKRVFTQDDAFSADVEIANFGHVLDGALSSWKLVRDDGVVFASGDFVRRDIGVDNGIRLGTVQLELKNAAVPHRYKFVVTVDQFQNDWDIWVYPHSIATNVPDDIVIVHDLNDTAVGALATGKSVLLLLPPSRVKDDEHGKVGLGFSSIFWNTAWTRGQLPHTLGILCDPKNPALAEFPTEYHSNWQWWYLISQSSAMVLDDLPADLKPTVQVIDDWFTARKLGLMFEAKVNGGKLLVCRIDLESNLETNAVARQMRKSVLDYMSSSRFSPRSTIAPEKISALIEHRSSHAKR